MEDVSFCEGAEGGGEGVKTAVIQATCMENGWMDGWITCYTEDVSGGQKVEKIRLAMVSRKM